MYALGVVALELLTGRAAFDEGAEPRRLARSEALRVPSKVPAVSWADVERLDAALAAACRDLAAAYGYDADPRYHPQSLDTTAFKA